jgi:hypothetical protein
MSKPRMRVLLDDSNIEPYQWGNSDKGASKLSSEFVHVRFLALKPDESNLTLLNKLFRWMWSTASGQRWTDLGEFEESYKRY